MLCGGPEIPKAQPLPSRNLQIRKGVKYRANNSDKCKLLSSGTAEGSGCPREARLMKLPGRVSSLQDPDVRTRSLRVTCCAAGVSVAADQRKSIRLRVLNQRHAAQADQRQECQSQSDVENESPDKSAKGKRRTNVKGILKKI